ncbi:MAG: VOC family protein [Gemmatimonadota bacterium]
MAILGIDHVIVLHPDLEALSRAYRDLGFTVTPGGRHPWGTHNALIPLADGSYVELMGFWEADLVAGTRWERLRDRSGLVAFMLSSDEVEGDLSRAGQRGADYATPAPGSRRRPDGVELAWRDAAPAGAQLLLPGVIQDQTPRSLRVPGGEARQHRNGATGIERLILAVADLDGAAALYRALLGTEPTPTKGGPGATFQVGPHCLELRPPHGDPDLTAHLARCGDSPYSLVLQGQRALHFASARAAGARIEMRGA